MTRSVQIDFLSMNVHFRPNSWYNKSIGKWSLECEDEIFVLQKFKIVLIFQLFQAFCHIFHYKSKSSKL